MDGEGDGESEPASIPFHLLQAFVVGLTPFCIAVSPTAPSPGHRSSHRKLSFMLISLKRMAAPHTRLMWEYKKG